MDCTVVKVVGKQVLDFVNKETGEKIKGVNLYIIRPDENVEGFKSIKQFIGQNSSAYQDALDLDFSSGPVDCCFDYSYNVGQTRPVLESISLAK